MVTTLIVTEDLRFRKHSGVDLRGLLRAVAGQFVPVFKGGGSTITMQLAENLYRTSSQNRGTIYAKSRKLGMFVTKIKEWIIAIQLEKSYTKEEILAMYLNTIEFGSNSFGIKVAAKTFFNRSPSELSYNEAAVLVGSINLPTANNPFFNPENAFAKRSEVLQNLVRNDILGQTAVDSLKALPLNLNYSVANHTTGHATYFRSVIRRFLLNWCKENNYDLFADGLKIHTTIDTKMQLIAEESVQTHMKSLQQKFLRHFNGKAPWIDENGMEILDFIEKEIKKTKHYKALKKRFPNDPDSIEHHLNIKKKMKVFHWDGELDTVFSAYDSLKYYKHFLHTGFMAMNPTTGHIKAWVGGINYKYFQFDHVLLGKRQPGSTIKPIVYTAAIDNGYKPCDKVKDVAVTYSLPNGETWTPDNANGKFTNTEMTIRQAMARSINSATAKIMQDISPIEVVKYAKLLGIKSRLEAVPALCLGAGGDVSLFEMLGAYSTFVNNGTYTKPYFITKIEDKNGNILQKFVPNKKEVLNENTAYKMIHMLKGTTEEVGGTARILDVSLLENNELAAKTGTTDNASDGWFIGVTKDLAAGTWVGGDNRSIHFRNWSQGQGARTAMPIYEKFMLRIYADSTIGVSKGAFDRPKTLDINLDCGLSEFEVDSVRVDRSVKEDEFG